MTQEKWIVDASALLAAVHNEKGGDYVQQHIERCMISTINWSEVLQKLERSNVDTQCAKQAGVRSRSEILLHRKA